MRKSALGVLFLTVFVDLLGFGIVLPLLPRYADRYDASGGQIGLLLASFSAMQLLFAPLWGVLSDRLGRRREARYWAMTPVDGEFEPNDEVDEVSWVRFDRLAEVLTQPRELQVVRGLRVVRSPAA